MENMKKPDESPVGSQIDRLNLAIQTMINVKELPDPDTLSPCSTLGRHTCQLSVDLSEFYPYEEDALIGKLDSLVCALERSKMQNEDLRSHFSAVECRLEDAYDLYKDISAYIKLLEAGKPASVSLRLGRLCVQLVPGKGHPDLPLKEDIAHGFLRRPGKFKIPDIAEWTDIEEKPVMTELPKSSLLKIQARRINLEKEMSLKRLEEIDWQLTELSFVRQKLEDDKREVNLSKENVLSLIHI